MRKILLVSFFLFLVACPKKEDAKNTIEKTVNDATTNVKKQLDRVENAAKKNSEDFSKKVEEESQNMVNSANNAVNKSLDAAKEIGNEIKETPKSNSNE